MTPAGLGELRAEAEQRLGGRRLVHVRAVVETVAAIGAGGGWSAGVVDAALRAAWVHDALKEEGPASWLATIVAAGLEPDPWARAHAPHLLHAQAAAAWARVQGERDAAVLSAVEHHPTAHPAWGTVGRLLYVADFCEPSRPFAAELDTAALRARAAEGEEGLAEAARCVLALRLRWLLASGRPIHPLSWESWNAWALDRSRRPAKQEGGG